MTSGYSSSTYLNWDFWVPAGVSTLTTLFTSLTVVLSITWFKYYRSSAHHFLELTYQFAKLVMQDSLQRNVQSRPPQLLLYDQAVSPVVMILLFTVTPAVFIPAFVSFWASFLVEETYACDPGLDCFYRDSSSFSIRHQQPLVNCTTSDGDTVVCFQFVFDYVAGFASMGGFVVVAVTSLRVYGIVLVWLVGTMPSPRRDRGEKCYTCRALSSIVGVFAFFLAPVIIAVLVLITALLQPIVNDIVFQSNERVLKFATYWSCLLFTGLMAGVCTLVTVLGNHLQGEERGGIGDTDTDESLEARFDASFNMSASNPPTAKNLNSNFVAVQSSPQACDSEPVESDLNRPPLVGSVLSSYRDVTSLPPRHTESSFLLNVSKSPDYQTT